jgi:hypothetical protein
MVINLIMVGQEIYAQNNSLFDFDFGLQISTLGEVGFFMAYKYVYYGMGMHLWNDIEEEPYWYDMTFRLGYNHKFKTGIGLLGGLQIRWLNTRSFGKDEMHFIFMPEIGISYTLKKLYGNAAFQLDTNNIKNSTLCFVIGGAL